MQREDNQALFTYFRQEIVPGLLVLASFCALYDPIRIPQRISFELSSTWRGWRRYNHNTRTPQGTTTQQTIQTGVRQTSVIKKQGGAIALPCCAAPFHAGVFMRLRLRPVWIFSGSPTLIPRMVDTEGSAVGKPPVSFCHLKRPSRPQLAKITP